MGVQRLAHVNGWPGNDAFLSVVVAALISAGAGAGAEVAGVRNAAGFEDVGSGAGAQTVTAADRRSAVVVGAMAAAVGGIEAEVAVEGWVGSVGSRSVLEQGAQEVWRQGFAAA